MQISEDEVTRVASLARLSLDKAETARLADQLSTVLKHFENVSKVKTDGVEPLVTPSDIEELWRVDEVKRWESTEAAMQNAPEAIGNLFKVPPVVG